MLDAHCTEIGRDPAEIERSALVGGDPEASGPSLRELGVGLFVVSVRDLDLEPVRAWPDWRDNSNG